MGFLAPSMARERSRAALEFSASILVRQNEVLRAPLARGTRRPTSQYAYGGGRRRPRARSSRLPTRGYLPLRASRLWAMPDVSGCGAIARVQTKPSSARRGFFFVRVLQGRMRMKRKWANRRGSPAFLVFGKLKPRRARSAAMQPTPRLRNQSGKTIPEIPCRLRVMNVLSGGEGAQRKMKHAWPDGSRPPPPRSSHTATWLIYKRRCPKAA